MDPRKQLKARMADAMKEGDFETDQQVADAINELLGLTSEADQVKQQNINGLSSGRVLSSMYIPHVAHVCGVDALWLATGHGEKVPPKSGPDLTKSKRTEDRIAVKVKRLDETAQKSILQLVETMINIADPGYWRDMAEFRKRTEDAKRQHPPPVRAKSEK